MDKATLVEKLSGDEIAGLNRLPGWNELIGAALELEVRDLSCSAEYPEDLHFFCVALARFIEGIEE